jgi:DNA-binding CsgD family transcriptional regulator
MRTSDRLSVILAATGAIAALGIGFLLIAEGERIFAPKLLVCMFCAASCTASRVFMARGRRRAAAWRAKGRSTLRLSDFGLTEREKEFALDLLDGMPSKEIAAFRGVSDSTVRNTLASAYTKLDIDGQAELYALGEKYHVE